MYAEGCEGLHHLTFLKSLKLCLSSSIRNFKSNQIVKSNEHGVKDSTHKYYLITLLTLYQFDQKIENKIHTN